MTHGSLFRGTVGELGGAIAVARSSWDRIEVADENGRLRFAIAASGHDRIGEVALLADHVVASRSTGIVTTGFRAWDRFGALALDVPLEPWDFDPRVFAGDGSEIVVAGSRARVWDLAARREREPLARVSRADAIAVAGPVLAWVSADDSEVHVATGERVYALRLTTDVERLDLAGGLLLGSLADDSLVIWDVVTGDPLHHVAGVGGVVHVSRSRRHAACARRRRNEPSVLTLLDVGTGALEQPVHALGALVDEPRGEVVFADTSRTWRAPLRERSATYRS